MAEKAVVIVESPTKAKTIRKFLPSNFVVEASMGHVRDLPQTAADIPPKLKKEPWARVGINVESEFEPLYVTVKGKSKIITSIRQKLKDADVLYLATDEDREGESISWHLIQLLKPKIPVKRMVFHEITKTAIQDALKNCREIDQRLVQAQETRRILDRLVGFTLSPLIWKKIAYGLSAGRVQSAGLRLLVERERERRIFVKSVYWDLKADIEKDHKKFEAKLLSYQGKPLASGKDFDELTGQLKKPNEYALFDEAKANRVLSEIKSKPWNVIQVEEKDFTQRPVAPFITSTLQQEANRKLGLSAKNAMRIAQSLYEQGLITYMRTDSPNLSQQAILGARDAVKELYGTDYLSASPRQFTSKSKGAQEAHEAIRPAGSEFVLPKETGLTGKDYDLYELIWKRTVASQMADAKKKSLSVKIQAGDGIFQANGRRIVFAGFLRAYVEGSDDPESALEDQEVILPELNKGDTVLLRELRADEHETKPPARFTEASLVQRLEKEGIGRPSTYASIISTVQDRGYVVKSGNSLVPTFTGFAVVQLLEKHFHELVDYQFTSKMEESLDEIAAGERSSLPYLKEFYLGDSGLQSQVEKKEKKIDADESRTINLFKNRKDVELKVGRFGPYLIKKEEGAEDVRASIPEDIFPADLSEDTLDEIIEASEKGPQSIGKDPKTGEPIFCLLGRYGPYVQLGEVTDENPKPRRASVPKEINYRELTLEQALKLLSLPREVGVHPETGKPVMVNRGRFGPYIAYDGEFRSLKKDDDIFTVSLVRCLEILAEEKKSRRSKVLKDFGKHPKTDKNLALYEGKYGPYLKHGTKNVSVPKDENAEAMTLERAVEIVGVQAEDSKKAPTAKKASSSKKKKKKAASAKKSL